MEVSLFPNPRRPGIGLRPKREAQRPLLPLHARHCPVLEAGSSLGFLVHPPLGEKESFQVGYEGEGRYELIYSVNPTGRKWAPVFSVTFLMPVGGIGATKEEVKIMIPEMKEAQQTALLMARMFIVPEDLGTPAGAVTLRGAWNFQTPPGWDTVYTPIFNMIERPMAPMLTIRVETDWYVHDTEFRYVLQPGESISASHSMPIGQVFFVPREEVVLRDGTEEQIAARLKSSQVFFHEKSSTKLRTPYGMEYSPVYQRMSRQRGASSTLPSAEAQPEPEPPSAAPQRPQNPSAMGEVASVPKVGRNDPCPCGSGRKYKKCHGESA